MYTDIWGTKKLGHTRYSETHYKEAADAAVNPKTFKLLEDIRMFKLPDYPLLVRLSDGELTLPELADLLGWDRVTTWRRHNRYLKGLRDRL